MCHLGPQFSLSCSENHPAHFTASNKRRVMSVLRFRVTHCHGREVIPQVERPAHAVGSPLAAEKDLAVVQLMSPARHLLVHYLVGVCGKPWQVNIRWQSWVCSTFASLLSGVIFVSGPCNAAGLQSAQGAAGKMLIYMNWRSVQRHIGGGNLNARHAQPPEHVSTRIFKPPATLV